MTFGDFFQAVCEHLTLTHNWDDPYATFAPNVTGSVELLNLIYEQFQKEDACPEETAKILHHEWIERTV